MICRSSAFSQQRSSQKCGSASQSIIPSMEHIKQDATNLRLYDKRVKDSFLKIVLLCLKDAEWAEEANSLSDPDK
jgi:hypothetical protein